MKHHLLLLILSSFCFFSFAEKDPQISLAIDTRVDFDSYIYYNDTLPNKSGFGGKYLLATFNGQINDKFSYMFRHRFNIATGDNSSFFGATDFAWISYKINKKFTVMAGKQVVGFGGYEYDYNPIDMYIWSDFWNNVDCYRMGVTLTYKTEKHTLVGQFQNSPFSRENFSNLYGYNAMWYGNMGAFNTIYSLNALEYKEGNYIYYLAMGNQFKVNNFTLELDYMNRYSPKYTSFWKDFTLIGNARYKINSQLGVFVKAGYDQNLAQTDLVLVPEVPIREIAIDKFVLPGVEYTFYGLGAEYYPLKNKQDLRLHAFLAQNSKLKNGLQLNLGVRWRIQAI